MAGAPATVLVALAAVSAVSAASSGTTPPGCDTLALRFGTDVQATDQRAVDAARAALTTAQVPQPGPARTPSTRTSARPKPVRTTLAVTGPSPSRLRAAQAAVGAAQGQVAAAAEELARVVAEQQRSEDPALYDEQVAAAEEALSVAREQLADDRRVLAVLREQARRAEAARSRPAVVVGGAPSPARTVPPTAPSTSLAVLQKRLADAEALQAEHLAARRTELERAREQGCPVA